MNKGIIKEGVLGVLQLRWQSLFKNYRSQVTNKAIPAEILVNTQDTGL
jgi:dolichol-phosphate mannosyltransferase